MPPEIPRNVDTVLYFSEHISSTKEGRKDSGVFAKTCKIVLLFCRFCTGDLILEYGDIWHLKSFYSETLNFNIVILLGCVLFCLLLHPTLLFSQSRL